MAIGLVRTHNQGEVAHCIRCQGNEIHKEPTKSEFSWILAEDVGPCDRMQTENFFVSSHLGREEAQDHVGNKEHENDELNPELFVAPLRACEPTRRTASHRATVLDCKVDVAACRDDDW